MPRLSVLDLAFVTTAGGPRQALRNSVEIAQAADELGYYRYWVAEHHNLASVASSAPEIIMARVADATSRIRIGSGGIMLPNHAPLAVAERFKTLEAFHPGRIDLGLGRAPGTDSVTSYALRQRQRQGEGDDFLERLQELLLLETGDFPERHPFRSIVAMPADVPLPPVFILGSSDYGAALAARMGLGYAFAHHFASHDAATSLRDYRTGFVQTGWREGPYAILAIAAVAAASDAEAVWLASSADLNALRRARGDFRPLPSPEEAAAHVLGAEEVAEIERNRSRLFVGTPERIADALAPLLAETGADEVMITSPIYDHAARLESYRLLSTLAVSMDAPVRT
jgi:luciferase family oxidoreductase group 1